VQEILSKDEISPTFLGSENTENTLIFSEILEIGNSEESSVFIKIF